ncbi:hypothetical protein [Candidatus Nitrosacidococcus tergens]|uniref:Lipocalin-like domain-containing protein n=1 Tax=Candidatus Nitrosacidococcus tergens TaxID=553981 RepID=A0A7G1QAP7_9GAMM|nr:hypothetical protein [Candidatus Nitrosacidococcus tergens]CAB1276495.1 conserved protein of unknown function [Candidatus Nitrosacidococcus tergens]
MNNRNILASIFFLIPFLVTTAIYAQVEIKDPSEMAGAWLMEMTALKQDGGGSNKEEQTWEFDPSDGIVIQSGYNKFVRKNTKFTKNYKIVNNTVVEISDASDTTKYKVIEKTPTKMVLKGPYGYHFFKKK